MLYNYFLVKKTNQLYMHNAIRVINNTLFMSLDAISIFDYKIFFVINNVF